MGEERKATHRCRATTIASVTAKRHSGVVVTFGLALLSEATLGATVTAPYAVAGSSGRVRWYFKCFGKYARYNTRLHVSFAQKTSRELT